MNGKETASSYAVVLPGLAVEPATIRLRNSFDGDSPTGMADLPKLFFFHSDFTLQELSIALTIRSAAVGTMQPFRRPTRRRVGFGLEV